MTVRDISAMFVGVFWVLAVVWAGVWFATSETTFLVLSFADWVAFVLACCWYGDNTKRKATP